MMSALWWWWKWWFISWCHPVTWQHLSLFSSEPCSLLKGLMLYVTWVLDGRVLMMMTMITGQMCDVITIIHSTQCVMLWVSEHFVTSQYVMLCIAHREFCGREDFDTCGEISGHTHSGLWWLWWRSGRRGRSPGRRSGCVIWNKRLGSLLLTLCIVYCYIWGYILWSIFFTCHGSTVANKGKSLLFMCSGQGVGCSATL